MELKKTSSQGIEPPAVGVRSDMLRAKESTTASLGELKEFLGQMRGKSPQEVLGMVAESGLLRATVQAALACVVLLFLFSAGPYVYNRLFGASEQPVAKTETAVTPESPATNQVAETPAAAPAVPAGEVAPSAENVEKAAKTMGIDEVKTAAPDQNPLEKDLDKLLDGIDK